LSVNGRLAVLLAGLLVVPWPAAAASGDEMQAAFAGLSSTLLEPIPASKRIAVRPFLEEETGLPQTAADRLYDRLVASLFAASAGRHDFVEREQLKAIFDSALEFSNADIERMLAAARADIDVICDLAPTVEGVEVACRANDILATTIVGRGEAFVALPAVSAAVQPLDSAIWELANDMWPRMADMGSVASDGFRDQQTGALTDLGVHVADRLLDHLFTKLEQADVQRRKDADFQEAVAPGEEKATALKDYRISGVIWRLDQDQISINAVGKLEGRTVVSRTVRVAAASVPEHLRLAAPAGEAGLRFHEAVGEAVVSVRLDRDAAVRAARNLARARVISQALGLRGPAVTVVENEADAARLVQYLGQGVTRDERFRTLAADGDRITYRVKARVVPVGSTAAPTISAGLNKPVYAAMEPIEITVSSPVTAHVGIFAWGADNMVVRLYPNQTVPEVVLEADETVIFPLSGEGIVIRSAPMPISGNREDHEAIIVVASSKPIDFAKLAAMAGQSVHETMDFAVPASNFLNALGRLDLTRTSILILPYQVHG